LQLIGRAMGEVTILRVADALERATTWGREWPPDVRPG
jgi:Asp-tRNA(Asn)/Glu-tRNA(Gln) amidotransferase A subunit family amidase